MKRLRERERLEVRRALRCHQGLQWVELRARERRGEGRKGMAAEARRGGARHWALAASGVRASVGLECADEG